jgi:uncharacterized protein
MSAASDTALNFPAPDTEGLGGHYWDALRAGRLEYQRCGSCGHAWLPARSECPSCLAPDWSWQSASGKAKLVSWVVYHHAYHPWFAARLPYNVAVVELTEGPRLISNVIQATNAAKTEVPLKIEMPLQLVIEREGEFALARFKPV